MKLIWAMMAIPYSQYDIPYGQKRAVCGNKKGVAPFFKKKPLIKQQSCH